MSRRPRSSGVVGVPGAAVRWMTTERSQGDFAIDAERQGLDDRRRGIVTHPWVWVHQVHGGRVVLVDRHTAGAVRGTDADALVTADAGLALAIQTADCAPVVLVGTSTGRPDRPVLGIAHAGWRGIEAGIVEATAAALRAAGAEEITAWVGPHIHAECYEFGPEDLDRLAAGLGPEVRGVTSAGTPALDVGAAVRAAATAAGVVVADIGSDQGCTACDAGRWYSHRSRGERERMATVVWRDEVGP